MRTVLTPLWILLVTGVFVSVITVMSNAAWRRRRALGLATLLVWSFASGALLITRPNVATGLLFLAGLTHMINAMRLVYGRMHEAYLRRVTRRTTLVASVIQILVTVIWWLEARLLQLGWHKGLVFVVFAQLLVAIVVAYTAVTGLYGSRLHKRQTVPSDNDLPTVTVAIPARNETEDLAPCLESILASDYPKLEILVLDDCSRDRTPDVIKGFAHDGVRFVRGDAPRPGWLAKNQAYEKLAEEATGKFIIFTGVDSRFSPRTIRELVTTALNDKLSMISVLPHRASMNPFAALIQPMRYWWELAVPRRVFGYPPVLSTCWLAERKAIEKLGGFAAVSHKVLPEAYFARELDRQGAYRFVRTNAAVALTTLKNGYEQRQTAIRTRYPQAHRRPEGLLVLIVAEAVFLLAPFILLVLALLLSFGWLLPYIAGTCLLLVFSHVAITIVTDRRAVWLSLASFPFVVLVEVWLLLDSMYQYEFGEVQWKNRNICLPVMHVVSKLPEM